jgi:hypothetical protein
MDLTQDEILQKRFRLEAAPADSWRIYDEENPIPGCFQFDWLSSRRPDLYHQFALSTTGLMDRLDGLIDLTGCDVLDIGAGTGRLYGPKAKRYFTDRKQASLAWRLQIMLGQISK